MVHAVTHACELSESHQDMCSSEQVAEGVVEQVDEGGSIQISVAHHLGGKQSLTGTTAKQTSHHAVAHVHVMRHFLGRTQRHDMSFPDICTQSRQFCLP